MEATTGEAKAGTEPKRKTRLIVRLGLFLISHSVLVSSVCFAAGIVALFLLPLLAKNTYVSENALMPGSANPMFSGQQTHEANRLVEAILSQTSSDGKELEIPSLVAQHMKGLGAEVYHHKFRPKVGQSHPFHFFSSAPSTNGLESSNKSSKFMGISSVGIIRAPRGDGKESIVIVTPYNSQKIKISEAVLLGLSYSVFGLLSQATWLAKDIVWVAADSRHGEHASVAAWLREYHNPIFWENANFMGIDTKGMCLEDKASEVCRKSEDEGSISDVFRRAGTIAAGLVLKVGKEQSEVDSMTIFSEASNGQMPNLDLVNVVRYLAVHRQGFRVKVGLVGYLLNSAFLKSIGKTLELLGKMAGVLNPKWNFAIPAAEYVEGTATLASSMYSQALGIPTGPHGSFRDYQIDAITLEISPRTSFEKDHAQPAMLVRSGRLIEGVIRSVNNLLEKFHQSFFLYLLTSSNKFVSVGVYMVAFALLAAPLPIVAAALFSNNQSSDSAEKTGSPTRSWEWIHAAKVVFIVHLWAVIVSLLPYIIPELHKTTSQASMLVWISLSVATLLFFYMILGRPYRYSENTEWLLLKAVMITTTAICLGVMSIINYATAQIGALFLVPMCLMVQPLRKCKLMVLNILNVLLLVIGFPPATMLMWEALHNGLGGVCLGNFWAWMEALREWNSATYLYLIVMHLPCWVLCMHVLSHP